MTFVECKLEWKVQLTLKDFQAPLVVVGLGPECSFYVHEGTGKCKQQWNDTWKLLVWVYFWVWHTVQGKSTNCGASSNQGWRNHCPSHLCAMAGVLHMSVWNHQSIDWGRKRHKGIAGWVLVSLPSSMLHHASVFCWSSKMRSWKIGRNWILQVWLPWEDLAAGQQWVWGCALEVLPKLETKV